MRKLNYVYGIDGDGCYIFRGSFAPNGAGAVDVTLNRSSRGGGSARCGFTAARTGAGVWTVTLDDSAAELVQLSCGLVTCPGGTSIQGATAPGALATNGTQFVLNTFDAAGAALDVPAAAGRRLQFELTLRVSRVF